MAPGPENRPKGRFSWLAEVPLAVRILGVCVILRLWIAPMGNSLWLDETLTLWMTHQDAAAIPPHQSPLFALVERLATLAFGSDEWALRLPPLLASFGCLWIFYKLGTEIYDRATGVLCAVIFLANPQMIVEASDARPYALAMFAHAVALLFLVRWVRSGRLRHGLLWVGFASLAGNFHQLFLVPVPLEGLFVVWRFRKDFLRRLPQFTVVAALGLLLVSPVLRAMLALSAEAGELGSTGTPDWRDLLVQIAPAYILFSIAGVAGLDWITGRKPQWRMPQAAPGIWALGLGVFVAIPVLFFVVTVSGWTQLFASRFLLPSLPGLVIFAAVMLRGFVNLGMRGPIMAAMLAVSLLWAGGFSWIPNYHPEGWRGAIAQLPDSGALFLYSGLVETRSQTWMANRENRTYATAPLGAYREDLNPYDIRLLPYEFDAPSQDFALRQLGRPLSADAPVTILSRSIPGSAGPLWIDWVTEALKARGYQESSAYSDEFVALRVFQLPPEARMAKADKSF